MDTLRKLRSPWVIVTLLLAAYAGSYFAVSNYISASKLGVPSSLGNFRIFEYSSMVDFYRPIIYVESKVRGETIHVMHVPPRFRNMLGTSPWPNAQNRD